MINVTPWIRQSLTVDDSHAGSAVGKYAAAFKQPARRVSARTAKDDELELGDEDERA
jgi:hypothetical protein